MESVCCFYILYQHFRLTLRSPRERWQSLGRCSGEVGGGLEGTCTPVATDFMLPFLGRAAAGGRELRGKRYASEDGPLRGGEIKKENSSGVFFIQTERGEKGLRRQEVQK